MKKLLIEFTEDEHAAIKDLAAGHGLSMKPFIEFVVRVQAGLIQEPKPIKMIPLQVSTAKDTQQEPTEGVPAIVPAVAPEGKPEADPFDGLDAMVPKSDTMTRARAADPLRSIPRRETTKETHEDTVKEADKDGQFLRRFGRWSNGKCYRKSNEEGTYTYSYI